MWWEVRLLEDLFNDACSNIAGSYLKVGYDSMSAIRFCTMSKGELTSLVLYLLQAGTAWDGVQYGCLLSNIIPRLT